jgi:hypothetical protein
LAAGFAREYDGEDLLFEPWHLLIPLGASVVSSLLLYALIRCVAWLRRAREPGFFAGYRQFLTLYWLTAPLAFLYAIPVERFLSAGDAMRANLWMLALVATWRVLLMTRVVSVLYGASFVAALFPVMLFADTLLLSVIALTPLPLLMIMGGVRLSEPDNVLLGTTLAVGFLGYFSWLLWFFCSIVVAIGGSEWKFINPPDQMASHVSRCVWTVAAISVGMWIFILPMTQPEQRLRRRVERNLAANQIEEGLLLMSSHEPNDFPPHWDPPPWITHPRPRPEMVEIQETAQKLSLKPWVTALFNQKFMDSLRKDSWGMEDMPAEDIDRRVRLLERLPAHDTVVNDELKRAFQYVGESRKDLSPQTLARMKRLLAEANAEPTSLPTTTALEEPSSTYAGKP